MLTRFVLDCEVRNQIYLYIYMKTRCNTNTNIKRGPFFLCCSQMLAGKLLIKIDWTLTIQTRTVCALWRTIYFHLNSLIHHFRNISRENSISYSQFAFHNSFCCYIGTDGALRHSDTTIVGAWVWIRTTIWMGIT